MSAKLAAVALLVLTCGAPDRAQGTTPEWRCQQGRTKAAATYVACTQKLQAAFEAGGLSEYDARLAKCRLKYTATWAKLQRQSSGTGASCDAPRFVANGNGTVTDNLTGLQWEQKTDDGSVHDLDDRYTWSAASPFVAADGSAFTGFLAALDAACFAGRCDWRLPTVLELATILGDAFPCAGSPCIDAVFGPTAEASYWTATSGVVALDGAWSIAFGGSGVVNPSDGKQLTNAVRAVRGGG